MSSVLHIHLFVRAAAPVRANGRLGTGYSILPPVAQAFLSTLEF